MKANELRIGNLVEYKKHIWEICSSDIQAIETSQDQFNPIPLNEEWLVKFGFKRYDPNVMHWFINSSNAFITRHNKTNVFSLGLYIGSSGISIKEIQYVHQLQNLYFALTGEELTIQEN